MWFARISRRSRRFGMSWPDWEASVFEHRRLRGESHGEEQPLCEQVAIISHKPSRLRRFWLRAGAIINSWCVVISAICMGPCFLLSKSPKDRVDLLLERLGLGHHLRRLSVALPLSARRCSFAWCSFRSMIEVNGELGFLEEQWDSELFGAFYEYISSSAESFSVRLRFLYRTTGGSAQDRERRG